MNVKLMKIQKKFCWKISEEDFHRSPSKSGQVRVVVLSQTSSDSI